MSNFRLVLPYNQIVTENFLLSSAIKYEQIDEILPFLNSDNENLRKVSSEFITNFNNSHPQFPCRIFFIFRV